MERSSRAYSKELRELALGTRHGRTKHRRIIIHSRGDNVISPYCYTFIYVPTKPTCVISKGSHLFSSIADNLGRHEQWTSAGDDSAFHHRHSRSPLPPSLINLTAMEIVFVNIRFQM